MRRGGSREHRQAAGAVRSVATGRNDVHNVAKKFACDAQALAPKPGPYSSEKKDNNEGCSGHYGETDEDGEQFIWDRDGLWRGAPIRKKAGQCGRWGRLDTGPNHDSSRSSEGRFQIGNACDAVF